MTLLIVSIMALLVGLVMGVCIESELREGRTAFGWLRKKT